MTAAGGSERNSRFTARSSSRVGRFITVLRGTDRPRGRCDGAKAGTRCGFTGPDYGGPGATASQFVVYTSRPLWKTVTVTRTVGSAIVLGRGELTWSSATVSTLTRCPQPV